MNQLIKKIWHYLVWRPIYLCRLKKDKIVLHFPRGASKQKSMYHSSKGDSKNVTHIDIIEIITTSS